MNWNNMPERVAAYLRARRALGFELRIEGEQLNRFARFAEQHRHKGLLTLELALALPFTHKLCRPVDTGRCHSISSRKA
ncbi:MAG: hypothetical protein KGY40_07560 [Thioalkalivibrio sp.]|nr:hypothetical protein [Thioalkalivibrio sp.]